MVHVHPPGRLLLGAVVRKAAVKKSRAVLERGYSQAVGRKSLRSSLTRTTRPLGKSLTTVRKTCPSRAEDTVGVDAISPYMLKGFWTLSSCLG